MPGAPVKLALVGLGYWGPNLLRAASDLDDVEVSVLCDIDAQALATHGRRHPHARRTEQLEDVLQDDSIDAVLIATPIRTHHQIAKRALQAGKHVFVEKPVATSSDACRDLMRCAAERHLTLMPGHVFLYSPAVVAIKEMLEQNALGEMYFITSTRVNLGIHQSDSSVVQDLAPHDFSILRYWLGPPTFVRAIARDSVVPGIWDVAFIDLGYETGTLVRVELSWLAPSKLRRTVLVGRKGMVVYDDTSNEQVRLFDCGVELLDPQNFGEHRMAYRLGDVVSPRLDTTEPLRLELADLVMSIRSGRQPRSHIGFGLDIVRMVEAAEASLVHNGAPVQFDAPDDERRRTPDRRASDGGMPLFNGPTTLPDADLTRVEGQPSDDVSGEPRAA